MKRLYWLAASALVLSLGLAACTPAEQPGNKPGGDSTEPEQNEEDITIDVPGAEEITRLPAPVDMPAMPTLPATDASRSPYVGAWGTSTDAYSVTALGDEAANGLSIAYPAQGKTLENYHYVWLDVYNWQSAYSVVRFDFGKIVGAEKVAVSAYYTEAHEAGVPPVGVLVEPLMDGELSYVTDLSDFYTVDKNYKETGNVLSEQTVCRLFVYFDSNPAQHPSDREGSLELSAVSFFRVGDPGTVVDNSPRLGEAVASGEGIALAPSEGVFTATYTPSEMTARQYVQVPVTRFTGAYGTIAFSYSASGAGTFTVTDGENVLGTYEMQASASERIDIRGYSRLGELRFYLDSYAAAGTGTSVQTFTLDSLELLYTPYVTADWDSTSKFHLSDAALGGRIKAVYDQDVGYDYLHVPVKYWTREFSRMVVRFKTSGTAPGDRGLQRYGVAVNSNTVLLEVWRNTIDNLPYDETTGEYTLEVDLSKVSKLASLNFYFDSEQVTFNGVRTVEFTSIEFVPAPSGLQIGKLQQQNGFTVLDNSDGSYDVSWVANKEAYYVNASVVNWTENYSQFAVTVKNTGETNANFAVYRGDWSTVWLAYQVLLPGEEKTFVMPVVEGLADMDLYFFINAGADEGSLKIGGMEFLREPTVDDLYDFSGRNGFSEGPQYTITKNGSEQTVAWTDEKLQWSQVHFEVSDYAARYKFLKLDFTAGAGGAQVGLWLAGDAWLAHTDYSEGRHAVYIPVPAGTAAEFELIFYFNVSHTQTAGSVVFHEIRFVEEKADDGVQIGALFDVAASLDQPREFTVTADGNGQTVSWEDGRSQWAKVGMSVSGLDATEYRYLKIEFTVSRDVYIGIYDGTVYWEQNTFTAGETHTVYVKVPENAAADFSFEIYFDANQTTQTAGSVTFTEIAFVSENPDA